MACGVTGMGSVYCWGYNMNGALGIGNTDEHWAPAKITGLGPASDVTALEFGSCALMKSGELEVVCITEDARITDRSIDALIERRTRPSSKPVEPEPPKRRRGRPRKHPQRGSEPSGGARACAEADAITS